MTKEDHIFEADKGIETLTGYLKDKEPFAYARFGDGDIQFMYALRDGRTADGEINNPKLAIQLRKAWGLLSCHPRALIGDFLSCIDFGKAEEQAHFKEWQEMISWGNPKMVHIEAPLLFRLSPALFSFYETIQKDTRKKLLVGPSRLRRATILLDSDFHEVELYSAYETVEDHIYKLKKHEAEVIFFCAGRSTKIMMAELLAYAPDKTYFDLGSGLDPIFVGKTRSTQVSQKQAKEFFKPLISAKEDAISNLFHFYEIAKKRGLEFSLIDGTLLGAIRDGDFCEDDEHDVDVAVVVDNPIALAALDLVIIDLVTIHGFSQDYFYHKNKFQGVKLKRRKSHIDIVRVNFHPERNEAYNLGRITEGINKGKVMAFVYPDKHHKQLAKLEFKGLTFNVPYDASSFLTARYGDWQKKIPADKFNWYEQSNRDSIREEYDML